MKTKNLVMMGILASILFVAKLSLSFLPNIEVVSLLIIVYTKVLGKRVFGIIYVFTLLEGVFYGFGMWFFNYLYVWSILALLVLLLKKNQFLVGWAMLSGAYGLAFGLLCAVPYFLGGGIGAGMAYWIMGLPYDVAHCIGNVITCLLLYRPVYKMLSMLMGTCGLLIKTEKV